MHTVYCGLIVKTIAQLFQTIDGNILWQRALEIILLLYENLI